jgi:hypothetical protein
VTATVEISYHEVFDCGGFNTAVAAAHAARTALGDRDVRVHLHDRGGVRGYAVRVVGSVAPPPYVQTAVQLGVQRAIDNAQ